MSAVTLVAAACGYFTWQHKIVSDRQEALSKFETFDGGSALAVNYNACLSAGQECPETDNRPAPGLSWIRECLGDEAIAILIIPWS